MHVQSVFTLLAVAGVAAAPAPNARANAALPSGIASGDRPITMEYGGRPLIEVMAELSRQSGLKLKAGPDLEEQKVTVRFQQLPLAAAARALAAATDGVWREGANRSGREGGDVEYRLDPSPRRAARLRQYRSALQEAGARRDRAALDALVSRINDRSPNGGGKTVGSSRKIKLEDYPAPLFAIMRALPAGALAQLVREANEGFHHRDHWAPQKTPAVVIPAAMLPRAQQAVLAGFLAQLADEKDEMMREMRRADKPVTPDIVRFTEISRALAQNPEAVRFEFWASRRTHRTRGQQLEVYLRLTTTAAPQTDWAPDLPLVDTPYTPVPNPLNEPQDLAPGDAQPGIPSVEARKPRLDYGVARWDRGLLEVARAAGLNLAADYYTKPGIMNLFGDQRSLREVLNEAEWTFRLTHFWVGETLVVRSLDWIRAYDVEPPASLLDRWDDQKKKGILRLDDYLEAARVLDDQKIATLIHHADEHGNRRYVREVFLLTRYRHVLCGYAALNAAQRERATSGGGLPLSSLSVQQLQQWRPVLQRFVLVPPDALKAARLYTPPSASVEDPVPRFVLLDVAGIPAFDLVSRFR